jgi:hypothetical protein
MHDKKKYIFGFLIFSLLGLFIGFDYVKVKILNVGPRFTVGYVTKFNHYAREGDNSIEYYYLVNGKKFTAKFISNRLNPQLNGKKIVVKFSKTFHSINEPWTEQVLIDFLRPPTSGWETLPALHLVYPL